MTITCLKSFYTADGKLSACSFSELVFGLDAGQRTRTSNTSQTLQGSVAYLTLTRVLRTGRRLLVTGGDDGSIALHDIE